AAVVGNVQLGDHTTASAGAGTLAFNSGDTLAVAGSVTVGDAGGAAGTLTMTGGGTLRVGGAFTLTPSLSIFTRGIGTIDYMGTGSQTVTATNYNNLTISGTRGVNHVTLAGSGTIGVAGTFNPSANFTASGGYVTTGSTVSYNGAAAQTIPFVNGFAYNNLQVGNTSGAGAVLGGALTTTNLAGNLTVLPAGTLDSGGFSLLGRAAATLAVQAGGALRLSGATATFPGGFGTVALDAGSTVVYAGAGTQIIAALNYGNLTSSNAGSRVLNSAGVIGVAGTFSPGTNNYAITGSTVSYNGAAAQTVAAFNYNNLTITGGRAANHVTLAPTGTIGVAGSFTPSATFTGAGGYVTSGSTVNYNGTGAQTVVAFGYGSLTTSGARGANHLTLAAGVISLTGVFTPSASFTGAGGYVSTGNTINYNGSIAQIVTGFAYNNLSLTNAGMRMAGGTVTVAGLLDEEVTFSLVDQNVVVGSLTGSGTVDFGTGTSGTLTVGADGTSTTFAGKLVNGGATNTFTKTGAGTLTLTGASGYAGRSRVQGGTLLVNAPGSLSSSAVTVTGPGVLGGTGAVGSITATAGGTVAPGAGGPGVLTAASADFSGGGVLRVEVNGFTTAGTDYGRLAVSGALTLGGTSGVVIDLHALPPTSLAQAAGVVQYGSETGTFDMVSALHAGGFGTFLGTHATSLDLILLHLA
ncbi:MAG TPA: autotransporter-associated beta strand repeat-containing protein, partial [Gemmataceae bacterium]|nr:autotransporter-associated beta strand repeat-containing protein [Gemmataceae bacterium]